MGILPKLEKLFKEKKEEFSWLGKDEDSKDKKLTNQFKKMFLKNDRFSADTKAQFILDHGEPEQEAA